MNMYVYIYIYYLYIYIYIYMVTPPHDRPRPSKHRSHRRVRAFSGVSSLSPPNASVKNHPTTETKKPKLHGECWNSFGFLVLWFFGCLVVWFYCGEGYISKTPKTKKTKYQKTKKPKNQKTKKPKNQRTKQPKNQKTKTVPAFSVELWFFGFGRRVVLHRHVRRAQTRHISIPRKKQIDTYTNTKLTLIPR